MSKTNIIISLLLLSSVVLWFFGFYLANTNIGQKFFLGLPLWSICCAVLPALLAIFSSFIIAKTNN